jgi:uncharacterized delta-60 repeat protein/uncharacterized repeat protein (TIGR01451 family)
VFVAGLIGVLLWPDVIASGVSYTVLTNISSLSGTPSHARGGVVQGLDGLFYGVAESVIYSLTGSGAARRLVDDGSYGFIDALTEGISGTFYGIAQSELNGSIFSLTSSGTLTTAHTFLEFDTDCYCYPEGFEPHGRLVSAAGRYYGVTRTGGLGVGYAGGVIFEFSPPTGFRVLHRFDSSREGASLLAPLLSASDGRLYGTTAVGGAFANGTLFSVDPLTEDGDLRVLVSLGSREWPFSANGALVQAGDGNLYGIYGGGAEPGLGGVFKYELNSGALTILKAFSGRDGLVPYYGCQCPRLLGLLVGSDGALYGVTPGGGTTGDGTVFRLTLSGVLTTLYTFDHNSATQGFTPTGTLIEPSPGELYGVTHSGGSRDQGVVFRLTVPPNAIAVTVSPSALDFGTQSIDTTIPARPVTVMNTGSVPLDVSFTIDGADADAFPFDRETCTAAPLPPGNSCTIDVTFAPASVGARSATLHVTDQAPDSPQSVALTGVGVLPRVTLSSSSLVFGGQPVGTTSPSQTITLTSSGIGPLSIHGIVASAEFSQTNTCPTSLPGGDSCIITVSFTPEAPGNRTGTITIDDNAPDGPQQIGLAGTGMESRGKADLEVSLSAAPVSVRVGDMVTYTAVVTNHGPATANAVTLTDRLPAGVSLLSAPNACNMDMVCALGEIAAGASVTLSIHVTLSQVGRITNTVGVTPANEDPRSDNNAASATIEARSPNVPPVSQNDTVVMNEDSVVVINVLANDTDANGDNLAVKKHTVPSMGALTLSADGTFMYAPSADAYGIDTFSYEATDGLAVGALATVSITILPVNDAPSFSKGPDQRVARPASPQTVPAWATHITPGPVNESDQHVTFDVATDAPTLFAVPPVVAADGTLTYTLASGFTGTANVTVTMRDDGGRANGGVDASAPQMFTIAPLATPTNGPLQLDPSCGAVLAPSGVWQWNDVAIQTDGRIVTAGFVQHADGRVDFAVARYVSTCEPDLSFGVGGFVEIDFDGGADYAHALVIQPDGKIIVGGERSLTGQSRSTFALARINRDGSLDDGGPNDATPGESFGTTGRAVRDFDRPAQSLRGLARQANGAIVAAGHTGDANDVQVTIARWTDSGVLDNTFGDGGFVRTRILGAEALATSVVVDSAERIVIGGSVMLSPSPGDRRFLLLRLTPTGALDPMFGGGIVVGPAPGSGMEILDVAVQPDDKIVAAGYIGLLSTDPQESALDFATARYRADGTIDADFGNGGLAITDLAGAYDVAMAVALRSDGSIVVAGLAGGVGPSPATHPTDFAVVRYSGTGQVESSILTPFPYADAAYGVALQADGRIVIAGQSYQSPTASAGALLRYTSSVHTGRDLIVAALSDPPAFVAPRGGFVVTDTTRNQGTVVTGATTTRFYLSPDAVRGADTRLTGTRAVPELGAGQESGGPTNLTVPASVALGTYRLLACADDARMATEVDESNNCTASGGSVVVTLPDLTETALTNPPPALTPGAKFSVTDTVVNTGLVAAATSTTTYYLSIDRVKNAEDMLLGSRGTPSLMPSASFTGSTTARIPAGVALGSYYVLACADSRAKVAETSETNNCLAATGLLLVGLPDVVVTSVTSSPASVAPRGKLTISDTVANRGNAGAGSSKTQYYLSFDATLDASDILLTGTRTAASLVPSATSTGWKTFTLPLTLAQGTYYVIACADAASQVMESDERNNCLSSASTVSIASVLESGPIVRNGHTYFLLTPSTWKQAEQWARALGGHLVTINDAGENAFVLDTFGTYQGIPRHFWIGLNDEAAEGTFVWSSGEPATYLNWAPGEPNNDPGNPLGQEDFAHMYAPAHELGGMWNDASGLRWGDRPNNGVVEIPTQLQ